jgi:hypothetical protein
VFLNNSNISNKEDVANVKIIGAEHNRITLLKKTNICIKFKFTDLAKVSKIFSEICALIVDKGGI